MAQTTDALKRYLAEREGSDPALFIARNGTSLDVCTVRYLATKYMKNAGIRKRASVHTLRHNYGTHKVDNGMPVENLRELMGHKQKETTNHYIHLARNNKRLLEEKTAL